MNLKKLSNTQLVSSAKESVKREQEATTSVLHHIKEVNRRRLFADDRCSSITEWVEKILGYPSDQAWRRVSAASALAELPELEEKLEKGELNLTHLCMAKRLFKQEAKANNPFSRAQKLEVFEELSRTPTRTAEKILLGKSTVVPELKEKSKQVTPKLTEITFYADENLINQMEKLKGLLSHSHPNMSTAELLKKLCLLGEEAWDPAKKKVKERSKTAAVQVGDKNMVSMAEANMGLNLSPPLFRNVNSTAAPRLVEKNDHDISVQAIPIEFGSAEVQCWNLVENKRVRDAKSNLASKTQSESRTNLLSGNHNVPPTSAIKPRSAIRKIPRLNSGYVPAAVRRLVFKKAQSRCENCGSTKFLQVDHKIPRAKNGNSKQENLRLLCRNCNQRAAIVQFGAQKMNHYF